MAMPSPHSRRPVHPSIAADIGEAWARTDAMAVHWASLRDTLAEAWSVAEELRAGRELQQLKATLEKALKQVKVGIGIAAMNDPNRRAAARAIAKREADEAVA